MTSTGELTLWSRLGPEMAAFAMARLDEDEAAARLAAREGGTWTQDDPVRYPGSISSLGGPVVYDEGAPDEYQAAHIARHDPARALREVAAHRAVVDGYRASVRKVGEGLSVPERRLAQAVAAIWSDHADYDPGWRP